MAQRLESLAESKDAEALSHERRVTELMGMKAAAEEEADRATAIARKIRNLIA